MMCFVVAIAFSTNIDLIKFLINVYDIDQKYYFYAKCTWYHYLIHAIKYSPSLCVIKFIINELNYDTMYCDNMKKNCVHKASENPNLEIIKFLVNDLSMDPFNICVNKINNFLSVYV